MFYVYILKWKLKHYIWFTNNIERRLYEHRNWGTQTTRIMWEFILLWYFEKETKEEALRLEEIIKRDGHIKYRLQHSTFKNVVL